MRDEEYLSFTKSTIVRSKKESLPLLRAAGALLSAVAPELAARLVARLCLRPPRSGRPENEVGALSGARARVIEVGARRVWTWSWGSGPTVLLVHGWGGRGSQLAAFVEPLVARGFSVAAFDAPAHGDSDGTQVTLPEMVAALRTVATIHAPIHAVVAHSLGAVTTARAVHDGLAAGALVFIGPPADLVTPALTFGDALGLSRRVRELMQRRIERRVGVPWHAFDVTRLARSNTTPLLVVHDRDDGEVPWQHGAAIARAWFGAELLLTGGLGHRRILRDPTAVTAAVSFIAARSAPASQAGRDDVDGDGDWRPHAIAERAAAGTLVR